MAVRNFLVVCLICGVFAVLFSNLVNYSYRHEGSSRFDDMFSSRQR